MQAAAKPAGKYYSYLRVSTDKQGKSGLGIEAQRKAVQVFISHNDGDHVGEFLEVESAKRSDRPQLAAALLACRKAKAVLVVAKLDRLSRNVAFLSALMEAKVGFVACDNPHASRLTIHILAAVAEHEREMISARTKTALAAAKARGVKLGGPSRAQITSAGAAGAAANRDKARRHAAVVLPVIRDVQRDGAVSLRAVARELTARGVKTMSGADWSAVTVSRLITRAEARA